MLYPSSWPMFTSISSATRRAKSTASCFWIWLHTTTPCWYCADRQNSAHHWGIWRHQHTLSAPGCIWLYIMAAFRKNNNQMRQFQYPVDGFLCRWSTLRPVLDLFISCRFRPSAWAVWENLNSICWTGRSGELNRCKASYFHLTHNAHASAHLHTAKRNVQYAKFALMPNWHWSVTFSDDKTGEKKSHHFLFYYFFILILLSFFFFFIFGGSVFFFWIRHIWLDNQQDNQLYILKKCLFHY